MNRTESGQQDLSGDNYKEYWTQHRTTLIAYEAQYVYNKKPRNHEQEHSATKSKKKNMEYEGSFLFPHKEEDKQKQGKLLEQIQNSECEQLKRLIVTPTSMLQKMRDLADFVKVMLELKHSCIVQQFFYIYDCIIKQVKSIQFEELKKQEARHSRIEAIGKDVAQMVLQNSQKFEYFFRYMKEDEKQTVKLFQVTAYCFLAQRFNFNINEYYCQAFQFKDGQQPVKKQKIDREESS